MKVKDISDEFRQIESLTDLIKLSEKYEVLIIDTNLIIGEKGNHSMYIMCSGNRLYGNDYEIVRADFGINFKNRLDET